jgi:peptidase C13-like protein
MIFFPLAKNLRAGARLALFLPVRAFDYRVSAVHYAALVALNLAVWIAAAAVREGFQGEFDESAVPVYLASVPLVLATAMLVTCAYRAPERLLAVAVALTASDPVFELVGLALPFIAAQTGLGAAVYFLFFGWIWAVSVRAVAVAAGTRRPQLYQGALAVTAMLAVALFLFPKAEVWRSPQAEDADTALADERLFHLQGELIERALAAIEPGRPGVPELYFVGFAPDASQDVFLREMRFVKRLFEERFGTAKRSIALVSSYDALEEFPIGSVTNLERSLKKIGAVMNPDEDIVFLFISAHGNREHTLSASQPPLELTALSPTALARMLHDAGIKWRVIVVSACYSGGFVEPLRDDNSIVITAAAPDRSSFGCEAGRDFTYFGQAFFRDALARTRSFVEAFELARALVSKQEAEEKLTPSAPQMAAGAAIAQQLNKLSYRPDKQ